MPSFYKSACALAEMSSVLSDHSYFLPNGHITLPSSLQSQIEKAITEVEAQLNPVSEPVLKQIVIRLMLHFNLHAQDKHHRLTPGYMDMLKHYPEDLVCAGYHHLMRHCLCETGWISELIAFMEPEIRFRRTCLDKLHALTQKFAHKVA